MSYKNNEHVQGNDEAYEQRILDFSEKQLIAEYIRLLQNDVLIYEQIYEFLIDNKIDKNMRAIQKIIDTHKQIIESSLNPVTQERINHTPKTPRKSFSPNETEESNDSKIASRKPKNSYSNKNKPHPQTSNENTEEIRSENIIKVNYITLNETMSTHKDKVVEISKSINEIDKDYTPVSCYKPKQTQSSRRNNKTLKHYKNSNIQNKVKSDADKLREHLVIIATKQEIMKNIVENALKLILEKFRRYSIYYKKFHDYITELIEASKKF